jgi:hypothetical protein
VCSYWVVERDRVLYEQAVRLNTELQKSIEGLHQRAGVILAASAVAASFLGGVVFRRTHVTPWAGVALTCFASCGVAGVWCLLPFRGWLYGLSARALAQALDDQENSSTGSFLRALAEYEEKIFDKNRKPVRMRLHVLQGECALLLLSIVFWSVALAFR